MGTKNKSAEAHKMDIKTIQNFFERDKWTDIVVNEEINTAYSHFVTPYGQYHLIAQLNMDDDANSIDDVILVIPNFLRTPVGVFSKKVMYELFQLMLCINYQVGVGAFERTLDDGEVRYSVCYALADNDEENFRRWKINVKAILQILNHFYPAFQYVLYGKHTAQEALDLLENGESDDDHEFWFDSTSELPTEVAADEDGCEVISLMPAIEKRDGNIPA